MQRILLAAGIAVGTLIVGWAIFLLFSPEQIGTHQRDGEAAYQEYGPAVISVLWAGARAGRRLAGFMERHNGTVTAVATIFIAAFTVVLALVTRRQARITRIAAEAARDTADALPTLERAYLFVQIDPGTASMLDGFMRARGSQGPTICFQFINHGKTPAIISEISTNLVDWYTVPEIQYGSQDARLLYEVVVPASGIYPPHETYTNLRSGRSTIVAYRLEETLDHQLATAETNDVIVGKSYLWFYGRVRYTDIFGKNRETGFCWRYYVSGTHGVFHPYGGEKYNYRT